MRGVGGGRFVAVLRFPGTNCDRDCYEAIDEALRAGGVHDAVKPQWWWHEDRPDPSRAVGAILPGGFSYGDYLRCGALASRSPVMQSLKALVASDRPVLGICNGFQILCEGGFLPGVLLRNEGLRFRDRWVVVQKPRSSSASLSREGAWVSPWHKIGSSSQLFRLPVAHGEGRYMVEEKQLAQMEAKGQVWLKYVHNPNGAIVDIAGVLNDRGNVAALMPHPERAFYDWMGSVDGRAFFEPFVQASMIQQNQMTRLSEGL